MRLLRAVGASGDSLRWHERLTAAYAESHRHYHTEQHIAECLAELDGARHLALQPAAVELALWFHDAVYDPRASDNEEQSAALAKRCLAEAAIPTGFAERVSQLVMATKNHVLGVDADMGLVVDVDLSVLGQAEKRFLEYEGQIQQEYGWVPENLFAAKRTEVLRRFLERERIYTTDLFHAKYERHARHNLETSISRLKRFLL